MTLQKNSTKGDYKVVLTSALLPGGQRRLKISDGEGWVLQQDGDRAHGDADQVVAQWNRQHTQKVTLLESWPANSPDLNPIENLWAYVQARVDARACSTFDSFRKAVEEEMAAVPANVLGKLVSSMGNRLAETIKLGGGMTKY